MFYGFVCVCVSLAYTLTKKETNVGKSQSKTVIMQKQNFVWFLQNM